MNAVKKKNSKLAQDAKNLYSQTITIDILLKKLVCLLKIQMLQTVALYVTQTLLQQGTSGGKSICYRIHVKIIQELIIKLNEFIYLKLFLNLNDMY